MSGRDFSRVGFSHWKHSGKHDMFKTSKCHECVISFGKFFHKSFPHVSYDILSETIMIFNLIAFSGKKKQIGQISPHSGTLAARLPYSFLVELDYTFHIAHYTLHIAHWNQVLCANLRYLPKLHPSAILKATTYK